VFTPFAKREIAVTPPPASLEFKYMKIPPGSRTSGDTHADPPAGVHVTAMVCVAWRFLM
jgi:hypothetical protein